MSKIEEMIKELCPNGVEWKKLGDIGIFVRGNGLQKSDFKEGGIGCIHYGQIYTYYGMFADKTKSFVSLELANKLKKVESGDLILACTSENIEDVCKCVVWEGEDDIVTGGHASIFKHNQNSRYIAYYFHSNTFASQKTKYIYGAKVIDIKNDDLAKIEIPLPPLPIQEEIVRILDKFVEQQEQLEKLIELRKKQYEYYREELLTPKEGEEWETKALGEIGTFVRGNGLQKTDFTEEGVGCIHYGQIYTYYGMFTDKTKSFVLPELASKLKKVEPGDIVLACTSENIEDVCKCVVWEGSDTIVTGGHSSIFKHNENPRFIAYFLKSKAFEVQKIKYAYGAKVIDIKNDDLEKVIIKLPSLNKQKQIVCALNNFESSIAELTSALEASKARYSHYRDQLLNFKTA